jgi:hypothetical protein
MTRIMADIKDGKKIPPMSSDSVPSFLYDWKKWKPDQILSGSLLGPLFIAVHLVGPVILSLDFFL